MQGPFKAGVLEGGEKNRQPIVLRELDRSNSLPVKGEIGIGIMRVAHKAIERQGWHIKAIVCGLACCR